MLCNIKLIICYHDYMYVAIIDFIVFVARDFFIIIKTFFIFIIRK